MSLIAPEAKSSSQGTVKIINCNNICKLFADASSQIRRAYKVALDAARRIKAGNEKTDIFAVSQKQMRQKLRDNSKFYSIKSSCESDLSAKMYTGVSGRIRPHETGRDRVEVHSSWSDPKT